MEENNGYSICFNEWALDKDIKNELGLLLIISSLSAEKGYCFASNSYLAKLFDIDSCSISRKIKVLEDKGYITIEYSKRGCEVVDRKIRLTKISIHDCQNCQSTIDENVKDNNTSINNINIEEEINKEEERLFDYYQNNIGNLSPSQFERFNLFIDKYGKDKVKEAIDISCDNNVKTFNYFSSVLTNGTFKSKKEKVVPEWIDKEIEQEELNEKELAELEKEFEIFN